MNLILIAACLAFCQAAKLNRGYLPPESAKTAGGNGDILQTPFRSQGSVDKNLPTGLPAGSYVNEFEGVVINADAAGTRATHSGLGNSRVTYGSTDSKVGEAAFRETNLNVNKQEGTAKPGNKVQDETTRPGNIVGHLNHHSVLPNVAGVRQPVLQPGDNRIPVLEAERFHAIRDRTSNIIAYQNDIGITDFNYAFQTDNGISAAEIGMAVDGVRSKGGYSYTGDDGQVYTISYTADEGGYRPQGSHIPTPPPIPAEILKALEQNAKDEAAGIVDDGSYDAKKYNTDHTKGNRPNDYNDKDKHNTFDRRPVFNVISTINQNSQANKPNRDEDNQPNGQNQFSNVNLGYTVNDKQISNFSNIRNQYENEFDILTNNGFNNNGPISNFKELGGITQSSNDSKNQSLNVPLSQQKLQDENEVPDSLNGRPNSYQAPIAAIQNQQLVNQAAFQKQTQAQIRPSLYQSSVDRVNQKQQAIIKPENSFAISNSFQSRPHQTQTTGLVQGQQNVNKKGTIFQNQFQNNIKANQQNQQTFNTGTTQFNANSQQETTVNKPHNSLLSHTFHNQANIFSMPNSISQTKPSSYETTSTSIIQNQKPIANVLSNPTQTRPTSYDSSITGIIQNQQQIVNLNNAFSNPFTTQNRPTYYDASTTGKIKKQQSIANSGSAFSNPTTTQARPSSYDASITGILQKQQPIANLGNIFSTQNSTRARPNSFNASISGTFKKQQQIGNLGNSFSNPTTTQARPSSYDGSISGTFQKQQPIGNLGNVFSNPTPTQARPTSYDTSISEKQQVIAKSENTFSKLTTTQPRPTLSTPNEESTTTDNSSRQQGTIQAKPGSQSLQSNLGFNNGFANAGHSLDVQYEGELYEYPKPETNLENVGNVASVTTIQKSLVNPDNGIFNPSTIQSRPNSYDASFTGTVKQQEQPFNSANENQYKNKISANKQNQITLSPGVASAQFINVNSQQSITDNNDAINSNSGSPSIFNQGSIFSKPGIVGTNSYDVSRGVSKQQQSNYNPANGYNLQNNLNTNQQNQGTFNLGVTYNSQQINKDSNSASTNFATPAINSHINDFYKVKTEDKPYSQDTTTGGIQRQQEFNISPTVDQFQNIIKSANQQNQQNFNLGITSTQFQNVKSQPTTEDKNNSDNSSPISQFSSPIPASPNSESSYEQPSQNFESHPTPLTFTFNGENVDKNNNKGLVAVSSSQNQNDDFQSGFLHKKFSIRRQQQINQQSFLDFLNSKNIANAPVIIPSYNKNQLAMQPVLEFSNLNSNNNAFQGLITQQLLSPSQLNQPNPTPQTFSVTRSDTKLFTAEPSRILSTPKEDTIKVSQGTSGITQASISPFPSLVPSTSKESGTTFNSASQISNLPFQAIGSSLGVNSVDIPSQQANLGFNLGFDNAGSLINIQNQGEIYEYKKPDQNLPLPTKAPENPSQSNIKLPSENNNNRQIEIKNPTINKIFDIVPTTTQFFKPDNTKTESGNGPKLLPSRPNFISNNCCFSSQNTNTDQNHSKANNDSTGISSESNTSTFQNAKEEFEGPKTQQTYDETGYHY